MKKGEKNYRNVYDKTKLLINQYQAILIMTYSGKVKTICGPIHN